MKKLTLSKLGCCAVIALFMPLGVAHAYDANDRIQTYLGEPTSANSTMAAKSGTQEGWSGSQGAQGPIRSDMTQDKAVESEKASKKRELERHLFPLNAEGS